MAKKSVWKTMGAGLLRWLYSTEWAQDMMEEALDAGIVRLVAEMEEEGVIAAKTGNKIVAWAETHKTVKAVLDEYVDE